IGHSLARLPRPRKPYPPPSRAADSSPSHLLIQVHVQPPSKRGCRSPAPPRQPSPAPPPSPTLSRSATTPPLSGPPCVASSVPRWGGHSGAPRSMSRADPCSSAWARWS
uniref:Uncharacterized protein n=1 Tax=Triticum urartu TaxID=4572 RepID=A0A8R7US15_TRIUA